MLAMDTLINCERFPKLVQKSPCFVSLEFLKVVNAKLTEPLTHKKSPHHKIFTHRPESQMMPEIFLVLSIMPVSLEVHVLLFSRPLIITFDGVSLARIKNEGTAFFIRVFDAFNIILNVFL